ncbi:unnamed protein product [Meloidogyne enterolobii]|uniref:Uncharacterized protein n=1 Tax=Meloidogyne enterolobii TaxID=390850 RepID=A0ACB0Y257_MELEN
MKKWSEKRVRGLNRTITKKLNSSPLLDCDPTDVFYCHYCSRSFPRSRISPTRHVAQCRRLNTNEDGGGGSSSSCSGALMENFGFFF